MIYLIEFEWDGKKQCLYSTDKYEIVNAGIVYSEYTNKAVKLREVKHVQRANYAYYHFLKNKS